MLCSEIKKQFNSLHWTQMKSVNNVRRKTGNRGVGLRLDAKLKCLVPKYSILYTSQLYALRLMLQMCWHVHCNNKHQEIKLSKCVTGLLSVWKQWTCSSSTCHSYVISVWRLWLKFGRPVNLAILKIYGWPKAETTVKKCTLRGKWAIQLSLHLFPSIF